MSLVSTPELVAAEMAARYDRELAPSAGRPAARIRLDVRHALRRALGRQAPAIDPAASATLPTVTVGMHLGCR